MEFFFYLRAKDHHLYTHATLHGQFELHGEYVSIELMQSFVDGIWIRGQVTDTSISLFPVGSDIIVYRSGKLVTLMQYTVSTFSFTILREGRQVNSYVLIGADTLSDFTIEIQLRDEWMDGAALTAFVLRSTFPGIQAGTGVIVTRNQGDVTVEELF